MNQTSFSSGCETATDRAGLAGGDAWLFNVAVEQKQQVGVKRYGILLGGCVMFRESTTSTIDASEINSDRISMEQFAEIFAGEGIPRLPFACETRPTVEPRLKSTITNRPCVLEFTLLHLLDLRICRDWKTVNRGWLDWVTRQDDPKVNTSVTRTSGMLKDKGALEDDLIDWDLRITNPPKRTSRMVKMRFVQAGRRQPKIREYPVE